MIHRGASLSRCFSHGLFIIMAGPADNFFLHVTPVEKSISIERRTFSATVLDQLPLLVGDRSGHCHVEVTRRYFRNPVFVIAGDDNFANKGGRSRRSSMSVGFVVRWLSWMSVTVILPVGPFWMRRSLMV